MTRQSGTNRIGSERTDTTDDSAPTVEWPDPSPLSSWWQQVMRGSGADAAAAGA
ncbi:hypothetical protein [Nocardia asteroides]|uniref:hypothetical protein n=1 Tax=Nocardia asteroides TaxID=1824 RepID=UPI001E53FA49|nr:hypothetical protein [Nocardia asteroides]UGT60985.1 hypothetical protein LTT61_28225 [Nocardia asteroides]